MQMKRISQFLPHAGAQGREEEEGWGGGGGSVSAVQGSRRTDPGEEGLCHGDK